jgi:hypothetical protein
MLLISFSTSGPSPAHVTALYSMDDDDDEVPIVLQPVTANAKAHANSELINLLVITPLYSLTVSVAASVIF